jgi:hypothetical protein
VLSFSFSDAPWRYYLRQEPDAAIPHVRIRAGGRPRGRSPTATRFNVQGPHPVRPFQLFGNSLRHKARGNRQKVIVPDFSASRRERGVRRMDVFSPLMIDKDNSICYLNRLRNTRSISQQGV